MTSPIRSYDRDDNTSLAALKFDEWWDERVRVGHILDTSERNKNSHWYAFVGALILVLPDKHALWYSPRNAHKATVGRKFAVKGK
jgi:hypothetical protein